MSKVLFVCEGNSEVFLLYKILKKEGINNGKEYERYGFQFRIGI